MLDSTPKDGAKSDAAGDLLSVDGDTKQEGVPDQYTFEAPKDLPEGVVNEEQLGTFMEKAKEYGLSQDQFQNVMSYYAEQSQASVDEAVGQWNTRVDGWREAARADKEIGGESFQDNIKTALGVVEQFGDDGLRALVKSPSEDNPEGLAISNHPAFLRFLNRIGKAMGDPSLVQGDVSKGANDSDNARLRTMYPSMFKDA